ncbi:MAG: hypothetical protein K0Q48_2843 [Bacillota bacterium]|nr:hypothetical protein [Bacillota bacterium]
MNSFKGITSHEIYDIHQLLTRKTVSATKSFSMSKLVKDEELKSILQQDYSYAKEQIKELERLLQMSARSSSASGNNLKSIQTSELASSGILKEVKEKEIPIKQN